MAATGVESVRSAFYWPAAQRAGVRTPDLAAFDARRARRRARGGIPVLPIVTGTPGWAREQPGRRDLAPARSARCYARFLRALVARYGPRLAVGRAPRLAPLPIRAWQIWNEPNLTRYWARQPFARGYVGCCAPPTAPCRRRPGCQVVLAGLPNESWLALRSIYGPAGGAHFDAVALHPYTGKPRNVVRLVELARREMRRYGDGRKPIWITELSWPAAKGKTQNTPGFETTDAGQAGGCARASGCSPRRAAPADRAGLLVHVALARRARRTRSTTRACGACAAATRSPCRRWGPSGRRAAAAGLREGAGRRLALRPSRGGSTSSASIARGRALPREAARRAARPAARSRSRRAVGEQREQRGAQRLGLGLGEPGGAARRPPAARRRAVATPACRPPSPRAPAARSPRRARGARTPRRPRRGRGAARRRRGRAGAGRRGPARRRTAAGGRPRPRARRPRRPARAAAGPSAARFLRAVCEATQSTYGRARPSARRAPAASASGAKRASTPPGTTGRARVDAEQLDELAPRELGDGHDPARAARKRRQQPPLPRGVGRSTSRDGAARRRRGARGGARERSRREVGRAEQQRRPRAARSRQHGLLPRVAGAVHERGGRAQHRVAARAAARAGAPRARAPSARRRRARGARRRGRRWRSGGQRPDYPGAASGRLARPRRTRRRHPPHSPTPAQPVALSCGGEMDAYGLRTYEEARAPGAARPCHAQQLPARAPEVVPAEPPPEAPCPAA